MKLALNTITSSFNGIAAAVSIVYSHIYEPFVEYWLELVIGVAEELAKSVVRESFNHLIRFINGCFSWIVSFGDRLNRLGSRGRQMETTPLDYFTHNAFSRIIERAMQQDLSFSSSSQSNLLFIGKTSRLSSSVDGANVRGDRMSILQRLWEYGASKIRIWKQRKKAGGLYTQPTVEKNISLQGFYRERHRGFLEECQIAVEFFVTEIFVLIRQAIRILLLIRPKPTGPFAAKTDEGFAERDNIGGKTTDLPRENEASRSPMTAEDFIQEAGYPQESHSITTDDGYILTLHRLPRPNAKRTVFFQHGILDTSLGWVASGVTDSLAFTAWDQGFDVWLGNSRSNPPRRHSNPNLPADEYWNYTLNELGMMDIGGQLDYIHLVKCKELQSESHRSDIEGQLTEESFDPPSDSNGMTLPYSLHVVGHSLGAAALLIYLVTSLCYQKPHYINRMILLSPAGFHHSYPIIAEPAIWALPPFAWIVEHVFRRKGAALMIPGAVTRLIVFKILQDAVQYPAIREFVKRGIRWCMNGDDSPWEFAMQLPHYGVEGMPGIALRSGLHLIQIIKSGRFQLYDYGSAFENMLHYGLPTPLDVASQYWRIDIPVDIVAGKHDGVIPPECVRMHVAHMRENGVDVSYKEFEYGHLEFSNTVGHDLQAYILERLKCSK